MSQLNKKPLTGAERQARWRLKNPSKANLWSEKNPDKKRENNRKHYLANKEQIKLNTKLTYQKRVKIDTNFKIAHNLRSRLRKAIKNQEKKGSFVLDLGCSIEQLKKYLESKFQSGMTWDNYGRQGWHIDHVFPLSKFDLTKREEFLKACNYKNLQPLWAADNLRKRNK